MPPLEQAARHQSRERALALLYESDVKGESIEAVLAGQPVEPDGFTVRLVTSVAAHLAEIDRLLADAAIGWDVARMAAVDRNVLRMAVGELLDPDGPPPAVVMNEAIELATEYSTEDSGRFVNGVLSTIAARVRPS
ncbi:MAG: transcription antitermination factor NusB [Actinomycetota bacterium]|nr:transcription antitermination factor NusB [Actinomycetota bacterium]